MDDKFRYPDLAEILARKASGRRQSASLSFAEKLEKACIDTIDVDGIMTKDLALASSCGRDEVGSWVVTRVFMEAVESRLRGLLDESD